MFFELPPLDRATNFVRLGLLYLLFVTWNLPIAFQQTGLGMLTVFLFYTLFRVREFPSTPINGMLILYFGAMVISTVLSPDPVTSLLAYRKMWLVVAALAVFVLVRDRKEVESLLFAAVIVAGLVAVYSVVQHYTGVDFAKTLVGKESNLDPFWFGRDEGYRAKGLHPSGVTYAHALLFPLAVATGWMLAPKLTAKRRLCLVLAWIFMSLALLFSLTRGVWVAFSVVLFLVACLGSRRQFWSAIGCVVVCGVLFLGTGPGVRERALSIVDMRANIGRSQIWLANLDMIRERPVTGWGFGNYKQYREEFYERYPEADTDAHAHNNLLQVSVDLGLLGLIAFVFLNGRILILGGQTVKKEDDGSLKSLTLGLWAACFGFFVGGLTQYNWGDAEVAIVWWCVAGLLMRMWCINHLRQGGKSLSG